MTDFQLPFRLILDELHEAIHICDDEGRLVYLNKLAAERVGLPCDKANEYSVNDFEILNDNQMNWQSMLVELNKRGHLLYVSENINKKTGYQFPVEVSLKRIDVGGRYLILASSRDISQRVATEKELAENKETLEQTSKLSRVGGWDLDLINNRLYWTSMTKEIHEVPPDYEPDFRTAVNFYKDGASRELIVSGLTNALENGQPLGVAEVQIVTAKGNEIWVRAVGDVRRDENGNPIGIYGSFQDIDKQKRTELKLEESHKLLTQLTRNVPGAVYQFEIDSAGLVKFNYVSHGVMSLYPGAKVDTEAPLRDFIVKLVAADEVDRVTDTILAASKKLQPFFIEFKYADEKGIRWYESSAQPERTTSGSVVWHGYIQDITDRKKQRFELQEFVDVTAEQNKRLLNFTYIISHNIRSHVANLIGILGILDSDDEQAHHTFLPLMRESVSNLDESIRNLNEVVSIQSKVGLNRSEVNLLSLLNKTLLNLKMITKDAGAEIITDIPESLSVMSNPAYLESILLNLVSNSIKYRSPDRPLVVRVSAWTENEGLFLEVEDNGLGIDMEKYRDVVFGMYKTFHGNKDSKGLGLFISKTQAEALGGRIEIRSEVNKGTVVSVYFTK